MIIFDFNRVPPNSIVRFVCPSRRANELSDVDVPAIWVEREDREMDPSNPP